MDLVSVENKLSEREITETLLDTFNHCNITNKLSISQQPMVHQNGPTVSIVEMFLGHVVERFLKTITVYSMLSLWIFYFMSPSHTPIIARF